jgi:hypothetical protein
MSSVVWAGKAFLSFLSSTCAVESEWEDIGGLEFYEVRRHMAPPPLSNRKSNRRASLLSIGTAYRVSCTPEILADKKDLSVEPEIPTLCNYKT